MAPSSKLSVSISILGIFCLSVLIISQFDFVQAAPAKNSNSNSNLISSSSERTLPGNSIKRSNFSSKKDEGLFKGDMIFPGSRSLKARNKTSSKSKRRENAGLLHKSNRWPSAVVIYELDPSFSKREVKIITGAMQEISEKTCIRFRKRYNQFQYVRIVRGEPGSGCASDVGYWNEVQEINLEPEDPESPPDEQCILHSSVLHELLHTLGFHHEQSRSDRDDYITINVDNIEPDDYETNFIKYDEDYITDFNLPYDYHSIMHYRAHAFAIDPLLPTIIPKKPNVEIGRSEHLSELDAMKINAMYSHNYDECERQFNLQKAEMEKREAAENSTARKVVDWVRRLFSGR